MPGPISHASGEGKTASACKFHGLVEPAESQRAEWWACFRAYWRRAHRVSLALMWRAVRGR